MPKAEVGSTKWLGNKMKAKGLQRLRWYCQVCERQMRDANGFKQHTLSESHVRQMQVVGQNANKYINDYSNQFKADFMLLLRTSHGEKKININHFYQEYIANKEHIHMNATKWPTLTEFAKYLGREGICRVEEGERGLEISWVDNSPEALRRQAAIRKKERQDKGDEEREQKLIQQQVEKAKLDAAEKRVGPDEICAAETQQDLIRKVGEKISLRIGPRIPTAEQPQLVTQDLGVSRPIEYGSENSTVGKLSAGASPVSLRSHDIDNTSDKADSKFNLGAIAKSKNVFAAAAKRNALSPGKAQTHATQARPMSEAERIMRDELQKKRPRGEQGSHNQEKRIRM